MLPLSARPYLVRAIYDWCVDEGHTPYVLVASGHPGVRAPEGYDKEGKLTLNIAPKAVNDLELGADRIRFSARFGAQRHQVEVPLKAVVAVFAAETHDGIVFGEPAAPAQGLERDAPPASEPAAPGPEKSEGEDGPRLRLVK